MTPSEMTDTVTFEASSVPGRFHHPSRPDVWEWIGLASAVVAYFSFCVLIVYQGAPLGHDEALYATRARDFLEGQPQSTWFSGNRAPGLPVLLTLAWLGNGTEPYLRLVVAATGAVLICLSWLMGRLMIGRLGALFVAWGVALTPIILVAATQVWPDVPGAAAGMAGLYFYALGLTKSRFRWWMVVTVVFFLGAATVIRFGAPIPLGIGLIGLTLWKWPQEPERRLRATVVALAGILVVGVILLTSVATGGQVPGRTISVGSSANPALEGFADYWGLRFRLAAGAAAVGMVGVVIALVGSIFDRDLWRRSRLPFSIAVATFVVIAAVVHGEARYLSPFYPWFWMVAGSGLAAAVARFPKAVTIPVASVLALGLLLVTPGLSDDAQLFNEGYATIKTAARSLDTGEPCGVFTSYTPQVEWYSGCEAQVIDRNRLVVESPNLSQGRHYLFLVEQGKRQPDGELLEEYLDETTREPRMFGPPGHRLRYVEIWELEK